MLLASSGTRDHFPIPCLCDQEQSCRGCHKLRTWISLTSRGFCVAPRVELVDAQCTYWNPCTPAHTNTQRQINPHYNSHQDSKTSFISTRKSFDKIIPWSLAVYVSMTYMHSYLGMNNIFPISCDHPINKALKRTGVLQSQHKNPLIHRTKAKFHSHLHWGPYSTV